MNSRSGSLEPQGEEMDLNYAIALDTLVSDTALRKKYAESAHKRVAENFLMQHMVDAMEDVYKELDCL